MAWLDAIASDAEAIYFLGDMFDYWFEYRYVVPKGYVRFLGKVAELADKGVEIYFFQEIMMCGCAITSKRSWAHTL